MNRRHLNRRGRKPSNARHEEQSGDGACESAGTGTGTGTGTDTDTGIARESASRVGGRKRYSVLCRVPHHGGPVVLSANEPTLMMFRALNELAALLYRLDRIGG